MTPQTEKGLYVSPAITRQGKMVGRTLGGLLFPLLEFNGIFPYQWYF